MAKTHKRIVAIASKRFREDGLAGIGIADLMNEAGLTVRRIASCFGVMRLCARRFKSDQDVFE